MSTETDALNALKTILATIDPDPEPTPVKVWVYPADYKQIKFDHLPVIVLSRIINRPAKWVRQTPQGGRHQWTAEIGLYLGNGPLIDDEQMALAEQRIAPWPAAMAALLFGNQRLNNTVQAVGDGDFFTYRVGHLHFWKKVYFGIKFEALINQMP